MVFETRPQWYDLGSGTYGQDTDVSGRIPILVDNTKEVPFPVMETSAELLYLLKEFDSKDAFGFKDELERSQALQWLFFWHGSGYVDTVKLLPLHIFHTQ